MAEVSSCDTGDDGDASNLTTDDSRDGLVSDDAAASGDGADERDDDNGEDVRFNRFGSLTTTWTGAWLARGAGNGRDATGVTDDPSAVISISAISFESLSALVSQSSV